jgi:hypothetical protein
MIDPAIEGGDGMPLRAGLPDMDGDIAKSYLGV